MENKKLIERFEAELAKVDRPGVDKLLAYIRKSDFYSAPASTRVHLSCPSGLLQHSLNVLDALRGLLSWNNGTQEWDYCVAGHVVDSASDESVIIMALLHDLCKTHFYGVTMRNVKNEETGTWEKKPYYIVDDKMPIGHGDKSVILAEEFNERSCQER